MYKLGLVINPIAGMGGSVGLKGTDGLLEAALQKGAVPQAESKATRALKVLLPLKDDLLILTSVGEMGENVAKALGYRTQCCYTPAPELTMGEDTVLAAQAIRENGAQLILFAGGDGTARDIYNAIASSVAAIGIPAGVKMHSPVYAKNPQAAGELAKLFLTGQTALTREEEVLDIDEEEYRCGRVSTRLYGYLLTPIERRFMQNRKAPTPTLDRAEQESIASSVIKEMQQDVFYIVGPGSTTLPVVSLLGLPKTLIGVDLLLNKKLVGSDLSEQELLTLIGNSPAKLILTPTGGQGSLLGRGNQQLSPKVIAKVGRENLIIVATKEKLARLGGAPLLVDTGDEKTDALLRGYIRVVVGFGETAIYKIA